MDFNPSQIKYQALKYWKDDINPSNANRIEQHPFLIDMIFQDKHFQNTIALKGRHIEVMDFNPSVKINNLKKVLEGRHLRILKRLYTMLLPLESDNILPQK